MLNWQEGFQNTILQRGMECFENKAVHGLTHSASGWEAVVIGSEMYPVEIVIEKGKVIHAVCACPYANKGHRCKHMAAVLYSMEHRWPEIIADQDDLLSEKVSEYSSIETNLALKFSIDVGSIRCSALLLNRSNLRNCSHPDEFTLDDIPIEYEEKSIIDYQGENEPLLFLFPTATQRQRNIIKKKYGIK